MSESIVCNKSFGFAVDTVRLCRDVMSRHNEYIISKQLIRSATSVGANCREAINAESKADFIHKFSIAQKECGETIYWLELLVALGYVSEEGCTDTLSRANEILRIIKSIRLTSKNNSIDS